MALIWDNDYADASGVGDVVVVSSGSGGDFLDIAEDGSDYPDILSVIFMRYILIMNIYRGRDKTAILAKFSFLQWKFPFLDKNF